MNEIKRILQIALPAMAENVLQFLMGMVDSYLVAYLGLVVISGVSVANNILAIYQAVFIALAAASSALLARAVGEKQSEKMAYYASQSIKLTLLVSLFLGLLSLVAGQSLLRLLGTEALVAQAGGTYLMWVGGGIVSLGLMSSLGAILRATGKNKVPMYVSLLSNLLNALFSAIAVYLFQAGIVGVALGTLLSRSIACLILWKQLPIKPVSTGWKMDRELLALALPTAGERLMMRGGDVAVVTMIVSLGTATVAGNAIGETLTQFNYMPAVGIATATVILVAQEQGKKNLARLQKIIQWTYLLSVASMVVLSGLVVVAGTPLIHLYTQDTIAVAASRLVMLFSMIGSPATAGTLIFTATWQGLGNAKLPFYATTIGMWGIRVGLGFLLTMVLQWGLAGVWLSTILDNVFRFALLAFMFKRYKRQKEAAFASEF